MQQTPQLLWVRPPSLPTGPSGCCSCVWGTGGCRSGPAPQRPVCPQLLLEGRLCPWLHCAGRNPGPGRGLPPRAPISSLGAEPEDEGCTGGTAKGLDGPGTPCLPLEGAGSPDVLAGGPLMSPGCWNRPSVRCVPSGHTSPLRFQGRSFAVSCLTDVGCCEGTVMSMGLLWDCGFSS